MNGQSNIIPVIKCRFDARRLNHGNIFRATSALSFIFFTFLIMLLRGTQSEFMYKIS